MAIDKITNLHRANGFLTEDPIDVRGMFNAHFQFIFSSYALIDGDMATRDVCCRVILGVVSSGDQGHLAQDFTREELYAVLTSM